MNEGERTVRVIKEAHHAHASRQAAELLRVAVESECGAVSWQKRSCQTLHVVQVPAAAALEALLAGQAVLQRVLCQALTA